jgi:Tfp pilus assembly protein PilN
MISLLPTEQKNELIQERRLKILLNLGYLLLFFSIFLGVLLFSIKVYLAAEIQEQKFLLSSVELSMNNPKYKDLQEKILDSNKLILQLNNFYTNEIYITDILEKISNILPSGVNLTSFSYQKDINQIVLQGKANTRDNFMFFKKSLESQKEVKDLSSPVSNLLKNTDIDFYFSFSLVK